MRYSECVLITVIHAKFRKDTSLKSRQREGERYTERDRERETEREREKDNSV